MTNNDMLQNIEYLREKADVSYQEAAELLERYDGNVMRVLVELEQQGRVFAQPSTGNAQPQRKQSKNEGKERATAIIENVFRRRLVVEKKGAEGKKTTLLNVSVPVAVGATIIAPYLTVIAAIGTFATGSSVRIRRNKEGVQVPDSVESFVDKTVSNIKETASSLGQVAKDDEDTNSAE